MNGAEYEAKLASQLEGTERLMHLAESAVEALRLADVYLDGFVWLTEPEASELAAIKEASEMAQEAWRLLVEDQGDMSRGASLLARTAPVNVTVCSHCGGAGVEIAVPADRIAEESA